MLQWIKSKIAGTPKKTKREILAEIERGDLVKVYLKPASYFSRCYPGGTQRLDNDLIAERQVVGNVTNCIWRQSEKLWTVSVSIGRRSGIMREYLFLEDEIEEIRKVNTNDL